MNDKNKFSDKTNQELIDAFNKEVGNESVVTKRMEHLCAIHDEFENRGFDYSVIGNTYSLSLNSKIKLSGKKIELDI